MTYSVPKKGLGELYSFFETYGPRRLQGLDESYFIGLSDNEKKEAWKFLEEGFSLSDERITALYMLNRSKAVELFKKALSSPMASSPFPAEQQAVEGNYLLMLKYVNSADSDGKYIDAMSDFAHSQFPTVRAEFAQYLPAGQATERAKNALKAIILTETERIPLASAITKFMAIHGMDFNMEDDFYKQIYRSLRSDNQKDKVAAMETLEKNGHLNA